MSVKPKRPHFPADPDLPSHAEQLRLFGEIDEIHLHRDKRPGAPTFVTMRVAGLTLQLLVDSGNYSDATIYRQGIAKEFARQKAEHTRKAMLGVARWLRRKRHR